VERRSQGKPKYFGGRGVAMLLSQPKPTSRKLANNCPVQQRTDVGNEDGESRMFSVLNLLFWILSPLKMCCEDYKS
jgi:hypothetical protein